MSKKKHEAPAAHTENDVTFNLFSSVNMLSHPNEGICVPIQRHNELADKIRHFWQDNKVY
jgi:hypothetical protein